MKKWIIVAITGIAVLIVGVADAFILLVLLEDSDLVSDGQKVFFSTSVVLVGIVAMATPFSSALRQAIIEKLRSVTEQDEDKAGQ